MPSPAHARVLAALLASCSLLVAGSLRAESPKLHPAELAISTGILGRHATTNSTENPSGISYQPALGFEVDARVAITNWLRLSPYYLRSSHFIDAPTGSLAPPNSQIDLPSLFAFSLGARIEPTWAITDRARTWVSIGYGWGRVTMAKMEVVGSYKVPQRSGVFLEMPIGVGTSYDVWKNHLAVIFQASWASMSAQSGSVFSPTQYANSQGQLGHQGPMPVFNTTWIIALGVSVLL